MSTTFVGLSLEAMKEELMKFICDEPFDMLDEFHEEEIADCVLGIASNLLLASEDVVEWHLTSCNGIGTYRIKVANSLEGYVTVSSWELGCFGLSKTMYYPFFKDEEEGYFAGLCSLASMINEAWYHCNN